MSETLNNFEKNEYLYFKQLENSTQEDLDPSKYTIIRCDGTKFHSYTKGYLKPFDPILHYCLDKAYYETIKQFFGNVWTIIYSQSDEVSIILSPTLTTIPYQKKSKLLSILPSQITSHVIINLNRICGYLRYDFTEITDILEHFLKFQNTQTIYNHSYFSLLNHKCYDPLGFDCRIFQTYFMQDVNRCLRWRRIDAINNLKQMWVQYYYSQDILKNQKIQYMLEKLKFEYNMDWQKLPTIMKRGLFLTNPHQNIIHEFYEGDTITKNYEKLIIGR